MNEDTGMATEHPQAQIASLGTRVTNIETVMGSLGRKLDDVISMISAKNQMNWTPVISAGSLITAILGLMGAVVYMPIQAAQIRTELSIEKLQLRTETTFDKVIARMELNDQRIMSQMVPRTEHELFWKNYDRTMDRVITRLDRMEYGTLRPRAQVELAKP